MGCNSNCKTWIKIPQDFDTIVQVDRSTGLLFLFFFANVQKIRPADGVSPSAQLAKLALERLRGNVGEYLLAGALRPLQQITLVGGRARFQREEHFIGVKIFLDVHLVLGVGQNGQPFQSAGQCQVTATVRAVFIRDSGPVTRVKLATYVGKIVALVVEHVAGHGASNRPALPLGFSLLWQMKR